VLSLKIVEESGILRFGVTGTSDAVPSAGLELGGGEADPFSCSRASVSAAAPGEGGLPHAVRREGCIEEVGRGLPGGKVDVSPRQPAQGVDELQRLAPWGSRSRGDRSKGASVASGRPGPRGVLEPAGLRWPLSRERSVALVSFYSNVLLLNLGSATRRGFGSGCPTRTSEEDCRRRGPRSGRSRRPSPGRAGRASRGGPVRPRSSPGAR
jgi:hypothetical protein